MSVLWQLDVVYVEFVGGGREKNVVKIEERCSGHTLSVQRSVFTPGHQVETLSPEGKFQKEIFIFLNMHFFTNKKKNKKILHEKYIIFFETFPESPVPHLDTVVSTAGEEPVSSA